MSVNIPQDGNISEDGEFSYTGVVRRRVLPQNFQEGNFLGVFLRLTYIEPVNCAVIYESHSINT